MVAMPWVNARAGTGRPAEKKRALSARVRSLSSTTRVVLSTGEPGRSKRHYAPDGGGRASKAFKTLADNGLITVEKTGQGDLCFPAD